LAPAFHPEIAVTPGTGADCLVAALQAGGARAVFGIPGTQTVPLFEALRRSSLRTVLTTSELAAGFMAGGWARVTGTPGVLMTIPGPGFTWALTGLAEAWLDSVPLLHITGAPPETPGRRFRQQELDQTAISGPMVKAVLQARTAGDLTGLAREGLRLACAGEPGPVVLQCSMAALTGEASVGDAAQEPASQRAADLSQLRQRLAAARRPVVFAGQGVVHCRSRFTRWATALGAPIVTTAAARGALPEDDPLAMGFDGLRSDHTILNELFQASDLVLVLGAKLGHNGTCGYQLRFPADRLVQVDASPGVLEANYPASLTVLADAGAVLDALGADPVQRSEWSAEEIAGWRRRIRGQAPHPPEPQIAGDECPVFFAGLRQALPRDAILVLDSGLHQIMARRHFDVLAPLGLLLPTDLQSMGFGIPTAIGARLAAPERPVVALLGDGGFAMSGLELLTAVREGMSLVVIVLVDGQLGQIRAQQIREYGATHAVGLQNPDFSLLATAIGTRYALADGDIGPVVREALAGGGVTLIEVPVGDSPAMRRAAAVARVREGGRRLVGPGAIRWLKRLLGRA
jgi:acetolactate synthase I/II/III large subunit